MGARIEIVKVLPGILAVVTYDAKDVPVTAPLVSDPSALGVPDRTVVATFADAAAMHADKSDVGKAAAARLAAVPADVVAIVDVEGEA